MAKGRPNDGKNTPKGASKGTPRANKPNVVKSSVGARKMGPFYVLLGIVVVGFGAFIASQMGKKDAPVTMIDPNIQLPKAEGYVLGNPAAPLQVLEFADFECPACGQFATITEPDVRKRLVETGKISIRFLDYPLSIHRNTWPASHAAACANEQGKFWEMHDALFENQDRWNGQATSRPKGVFSELGKAIGLDMAKWESCYDAQKYRLNIAANLKEGEQRLVTQTPSFVIGDKLIPGSLSFDSFKSYVDSATPAIVKADSAAKKD
jgi:protein-disulfide isomerase